MFLLLLSRHQGLPVIECLRVLFKPLELAPRQAVKRIVIGSLFRETNHQAARLSIIGQAISFLARGQRCLPQHHGIISPSLLTHRRRGDHRANLIGIGRIGSGGQIQKARFETVRHANHRRLCLDRFTVNKVHHIIPSVAVFLI